MRIFNTKQGNLLLKIFSQQRLVYRFKDNYNSRRFTYNILNKYFIPLPKILMIHSLPSLLDTSIFSIFHMVPGDKEQFWLTWPKINYYFHVFLSFPTYCPYLTSAISSSWTAEPQTTKQASNIRVWPMAVVEFGCFWSWELLHNYWLIIWEQVFLKEYSYWAVTGRIPWSNTDLLAVSVVECLHTMSRDRQ